MLVMNEIQNKTSKKRNIEGTTLIPLKRRVHCPSDVIDGSLITKDKRHDMFGKVAGGADARKPEDFQREKIIEGTGIKCPKTNMRINLETSTLQEISNHSLSKRVDALDYSEDFDGLQTVKDNKIYINLKSIVGNGGHQKRSLREVYWFIKGQLRILKNTKNLYFANILDGDEADTCMCHFKYLLTLPEFEDLNKNNIYIGDLKGYFEWFKMILYVE